MRKLCYEKYEERLVLATQMVVSALYATSISQALLTPVSFLPSYFPRLPALVYGSQGLPAKLAGSGLFDFGLCLFSIVAVLSRCKPLVDDMIHLA